MHPPCRAQLYKDGGLASPKLATGPAAATPAVATPSYENLSVEVLKDGTFKVAELHSLISLAAA